MRITLEKILTSPMGFGLTTASNVQRAICRMADGLPLGEELEADPNVVRAFGGDEAIAALRGMVGCMPAEVHVVAAIRCGKSKLAAAMAVRSALTCDLTGLGPGDIAQVSVVSLTKALGNAVFQHIAGAMTTGDGLKPMLVGHPKAASLVIRHHTGRPIVVAIVAGSRAGYSLVSNWSVGVVFDEAARMNGEEDGVVNFDHLHRAVVARMRPGAQIAAITSPWAPRGPIYDSVRKYHGKPCAHLVVVRAPGPVMNPVLWTPEAVEKIRTSPDGDRAYRTDILGEFADAESSWLSASEVDGVTRAEPLALPRDPSLTYVAAMDPATMRNAWTLVIAAGVEVEGDSDKVRVIVARCRQWLPKPGIPLRPQDVFAEIKEELAAYGLTDVSTDRWATSLLAALAEESQVTVTEEKPTKEEADGRFIDFRRRVLEGLVELPPDPDVRADLTAVKMKTTMRSVNFDLPTTADGRHTDYAPSVVLAAHLASNAPSWIAAMVKWRARGGN